MSKTNEQTKQTTNEVVSIQGMTITNERLIDLIKRHGESKVASFIDKKLEEDATRKSYHKKYNAERNETMRVVKQLHPELFVRK